MQEIQNAISCLGLWGSILIIFFAAPKEEAIKIAKKELFNKKHKKEIFEELDSFTDEEREKLLFLIREKIKEKKEEIKDFFKN